VASSLSQLLQTRPGDAENAIKNDLPNEDGLPNRAASSENGQDDNHDVLTGTDASGNYDGGGTCSDWTSTASSGGGGFFGDGPRLGHSWPAMSGQSWMAAHNAHGCEAGVNLIQNGPGSGNSVGAGGGYGGIYCFAKHP
jgi:hypothetical protein